MATFDIYARISAEGDRAEEEVAEQLDIYEAQCREWAESNEIDVGVAVRETNVSGATAVRERGLGPLLARIESGDSGGITTLNIERFDRDQIEGRL